MGAGGGGAGGGSGKGAKGEEGKLAGPPFNDPIIANIDVGQTSEILFFNNVRQIEDRGGLVESVCKIVGVGSGGRRLECMTGPTKVFFICEGVNLALQVGVAVPEGCQGVELVVEDYPAR